MRVTGVTEQCATRSLTEFFLAPYYRPSRPRRPSPPQRAAVLSTLVMFSFVLTNTKVKFCDVSLLPSHVLTRIAGVRKLNAMATIFNNLVNATLNLIMRADCHHLRHRVGRLPPSHLLAHTINLILKLLVTGLVLTPLFLLPVPSRFNFVGPVATILNDILFTISNVGLTSARKHSLLHLVDPDALRSALITRNALGPSGAGILSADYVVSNHVRNVLRANFLRKRLLIPRFILRRLRRITSTSGSRGQKQKQHNLSILGHVHRTCPGQILVGSRSCSSVPAISTGLIGLTRRLGTALLAGSCGLGGITDFRRIRILGVGSLSRTVHPSCLPNSSVSLGVLGRNGRPSRNMNCLGSNAVIIIRRNHSCVNRRLRIMIAKSLRASTKHVVFTHPGASVIAS